MSSFSFIILKLQEVFYTPCLLYNATKKSALSLSRRRSLSYRNQSIDFLCKSMDWFLYDNGLRLERVKKEGIDSFFGRTL